MEYLFKVKRRTFRAIVEKRHYGFFITIGGKKFTKCMEISVSVQTGDGLPTAILMQVKSEPECGYDSMLESGETPDMIKAGLQMCASIVPGLKLFRLNDDSNIECGISREGPGGGAPRSLGKPFALPQLSIAIYGKSWYERHFGATLENERKYKAYRNAVEVLSENINIPFEKFSKQNALTEAQIKILREPFEGAKTWHDFFKAVPRAKYCDAFYNWLPFFVNKILDGEFNNNGWIIDVEKMEKIIIPPVTEATGGSRKTRKRRHPQFVFTNSAGTNSLGIGIEDI